MALGGKKTKMQKKTFISEACERYRTMYESSMDAIMTIEPPIWKFTSGNPATVKMFGVKSEKEFISLSPGDLSPEFQPNGKKSQTESMKMIKKAMKEGSAFFDWTHRKYKGEDFSATVLLTRFKFKGRDILEATVRDVSSQKKLEQEIEQKKEEQQMILDSIPAWVFYKDKKNIFIKVNQAFCDVMKKTREQLENKSCFDIYPKNQAQAFWDDDLKVIKSGKPQKDIIEAMDSSEGTRWVKTDKIPHINSKGEIIGIIGFTIDITQEKKNEKELQEKIEEMEKINKLMVGRELKMIELKDKLNKLDKKQ